jgi:hypothetical protein
MLQAVAALRAAVREMSVRAVVTARSVDERVDLLRPRQLSVAAGARQPFDGLADGTAAPDARQFGDDHSLVAGRLRRVFFAVKPSQPHERPGLTSVASRGALVPSECSALARRQEGATLGAVRTKL